MTKDCVCHVNQVGLEFGPTGVVWKYSALNLAIHFHIAFVVETWLVGFALQRVKKKRPVWFWKPLRKQHNTALNGVENSSKYTVQC